MSRYIEVIPEIATLHEYGLYASLAGDYPLADTIYREGLEGFAEHPTTPATTVQLARVTRDLGFNLTRQALHEGGNLEGLADARQQFATSLELTGRLVIGAEQAFDGEVQNFTSKHQRREVYSEHAATLGVDVRTLVAQQILEEKIVVDKPTDFAVITEQFRAGVAYDLAKIGTNYYYATSIAANGARIEVVNGRRAHAGPWVGRAAASMIRASLRDRGNLPQAIKTATRLGLDLVSREKAMAATINPRTV